VGEESLQSAAICDGYILMTQYSGNKQWNFLHYICNSCINMT
jgi:hypothetical protein